MTTTTSIENDLEDVSEDALGDLDPDERATIAVEQAAAGNYDLVARLEETAPTKRYEATDLAFSDRVTDHMLMALYALWDLETDVWRFLYERASGQLARANYDQYPDSDWTTEPSEENGFHEQKATQSAVVLSANHLAWTRYAEKDVGVTLDEFLKHPLTADAKPHIQRINYTAGIADGSMLAEDLDDEDLVGWATGETIDYRGEEMAVEELAERKYTEIKAGHRTVSPPI